MTYNLPGLLTRITIYSKNKSDLLHPPISLVVFSPGFDKTNDLVIIVFMISGSLC